MRLLFDLEMALLNSQRALVSVAPTRGVLP